MNLSQLADRVEALEGPCRETDADIAVLVSQDAFAKASRPEPGDLFNHIAGWWIDGNGQSHRSLAYTASLDSAMSLVPEGCAWQASRGMDEDRSAFACVIDAGDDPAIEPVEHTSFAATPALALTAAALRAEEAVE